MEQKRAKLSDSFYACNNRAMPGASKPATSEITQVIASTLRAELARKNLPKVALARAVGVSDSQMNKLLNGTKQFDLELLDSICLALGLSLRDVIADADEKTALRLSAPGRSIERLQ